MRGWLQAVSFLAICLVSVGCRSRDEAAPPTGETPKDPPASAESKPDQAPDDPTKTWKSYVVGKSEVKVKMPPDWEKSEEPNDTLVFTMPKDVTVKFRLNDQAYVKATTINGEAFVRALSKSKHLPLTEKNDRFFVVDHAKWKGAQQMALAHYWFVGLKDRVVVMSLTMYEDKKDTPEVKDFVEKTIPLVIDSLQK